MPVLLVLMRTMILRTRLLMLMSNTQPRMLAKWCREAKLQKVKLLTTTLPPRTRTDDEETDDKNI